ncbi:hypothetical protein [Plantactinospora sp. KLBMP9567]|uniref:hypothetical protein n=1 Tax=Plantactinospora sp. KLBMP9567 TaxID=3085900 RepID=UPI002981BE77|nr:hypothetical protein [Plantactinospora sp. KLBMP9567]MDW5327341.1 hypothetical protein [Plantactinospora sp. KLBMP9567]MDW5330685.1 hypothetical protein [Plantactinospora sp. KLBMP9567]
MRRLLVTAAIAAALFAAAGCSGERDGAAAPGPSGSPSAGAPSSGAATPGASPGGSPAVDTSPAGGNGKEVCAAATKAATSSVQTFVSELGKSLQAASTGDTAGAQAAQRKAEAALQTWGTAMREQSARATDERLKTVLAEIATEVGTMKATVESVDENKLQELQQRLEALCPS